MTALLSTAPASTDHLDICVRAYVGREAVQGDRSGAGRPRSFASAWSIVFDTETTTDAGQRLRFGAFQVRKGEALWRAGLFHDLTGNDLAALTSYAEAHGLELLSRDAFVDEIFYGIGYKLRATIVGFNLPFDLSRIAIAHGSARGDMRGGFSLKLSADKRKPQVQIKHLSRRASLIRFAAPFRQRDARSERRRGDRRPVRRGFFVDVSTLASALYARSFTLAALGEFLKVEHQKQSFDDFAGPVTSRMIEYAMTDVVATWGCYRELVGRYRALGLKETLVWQVYSEASIGKGYLKAMGVRPWREAQPNVPPEILAVIMATYYGGRSEVRIRRELRQVVLCDFLSMYPTVCTLMGLWRFVIGEGMSWREGACEVRALLNGVGLADLQSPAIWRRLTALVQVAPNADILPTRAMYSGEAQATIGANFLTSDRPLWFTLADCIAAKLLTGKPPKVIRALIFEPAGPQVGLRPVKVGGHSTYSVDPVREDFYKRMIEARQSIKADRDAADGPERDALDIAQNAIKIAANATSYGSFVEINIKELAKLRRAAVHCTTAPPYETTTNKDEQPGRFFHPLLATLTTGAARLMLAMTERLALDENLEWTFCDTDSMAIAKPDQMDGAEFGGAVDRIVAWFSALNPYDFPGSILKVEGQNFSLSGVHQPEPLFCWAVSAKRYALFNLDAAGRPVLRKASAHGLGHLRAPYDADSPAAGVPSPAAPLDHIGVELWQHDLWWVIVNAAVCGEPDRLALDHHPALGRPAVSRYAATTPRLLRWFSKFNTNLPYGRQVKPFNFLLSLFFDPHAVALQVPEPGVSLGRTATRPLRPVAPFDKDHTAATRKAFDRETGAAVSADQLMTYRRLLGAYHLHPEGKFLNAEYQDRGTTQRRHVVVSGVRHIGKEANRWEEQSFVGLDEDAQPSYGHSPSETAQRIAAVRDAVGAFGYAAVARAAGLAQGRFRRAVGSSHLRDFAALDLAYRALPGLKVTSDDTAVREKAELTKLARHIAEYGLRETARRRGIDPSNLRRKLLKGGAIISPRPRE